MVVIRTADALGAQDVLLTQQQIDLPEVISVVNENHPQESRACRMSCLETVIGSATCGVGYCQNTWQLRSSRLSLIDRPNPLMRGSSSESTSGAGSVMAGARRSAVGKRGEPVRLGSNEMSNQHVDGDRVRPNERGCGLNWPTWR